MSKEKSSKEKPLPIRQFKILYNGKVIAVREGRTAKEVVARFNYANGYNKSVLKDQFSAQIKSESGQPEAKEWRCPNCGYPDPHKGASNCPNCDSQVEVA